ncbi:glucosaminidase domain-containing protein [Rubrobacter indicoceani]|uniref:glucosaminidase domain-containing protein n=1 Tax=Rubrobacter indicoceani TaxID=2051957 RepID=UPI0013C4E550|nr:glucosaminidase domain-containing protein [Rubrobacter indicoceani]
MENVRTGLVYEGGLALAVTTSAVLLAVACLLSVGVLAPDAEARSKVTSVRGADSILGEPRYTEAQVTRYAKSKGATVYMLRAIPHYYDLAPKVGIAPDVLVAQSMVETGYGRYGGDAKPWNMAGIKKGGSVGDEPRDFERPKNAYQGVRMHVNHMAAYTNRKTVGKPHDRYYDAKSAQGSRGYWVRRVSQLGGGIWAVDPEYSGKIQRILDEMSRA